MTTTDSERNKQPAGGDILTGTGEMEARIRALDWNDSLLGSRDKWSDSLTSTLSICLSSRFPMAIYWGAEGVLLYNDAWRPILGDKHPWALGRTAHEVWSEIWDVISPLLESVRTTGEGTWRGDELLPMQRFGYTEECYFDYTFNPIRGKSGQVEGILNVVQETTYRVLNDRRTQLLREIAARTGLSQTEEKAGELSVSALATDNADVPFALLYLVSENRQTAGLVAATGLEAGNPALLETVALEDHRANDFNWLLPTAYQTGKATIVYNLTERLGIEMPGGHWSEPSQQAIVLPIIAAGQSNAAGFLVSGINPRHPLDDEYNHFFELITTHIATALTNARAFSAERERAEKLAELDRTKTEFFSNVSHEFRTPLTLMLGNLEEVLRQDGQLARTNREQIETAHRNSLRLLKLVNNLLDFSRLEAGNTTTHFQLTDLAELTTDLASNFRAGLEKAGIKFTVDCPPLSEKIAIDREMWEKIVLNLLSNAFKFTLEGEIRIALRETRTGAELTVSDTGAGIPTKELPNIFQRFHRVRTTQGRSFEGSGIGLSLVMELVKLHQGHIEVASEEGRGTVFTVTIPKLSQQANLKVVDDTGEHREQEPKARYEWESYLSGSPNEMNGDSAEDAADAGSRPVYSFARVLLADDNADMRSYISRLLTAKGYVVDAVSDGLAALERLRAADSVLPDVILSDVMMPRLDGFQLLEMIRDDERTCDIPVVLLSARAGEEAKVEGLGAGADDYLIKPFSARELVARVRSVIELSKMRRAVETEREKSFAILESVADAFYALDRNFRFTYVNAKAEQYFGCKREDLLGRHALETFPKGYGTEFQTEFERALRENVPVDFEILSPLSKRWIEVQAYPARHWLLVYFRDINERKLAGLQIDWQNRILEAVAVGQPLEEILYLATVSLEAQIDGARSSILLANDTETQLFCGSARSLPPEYSAAIDGMPIGESSGCCGTAAFRREAVVVSDIANDRLWADFGELALAHDLRACWSHPIISPNGRLYGTVAAYFETAREPEAGELSLLAAAARIAGIVIERARGEMALQKSEEFHAIIAELSTDWAYTARVEPDGAVVTESVTDGFTKLFGFTAEELMAAGGWAIISHPDDLEYAQSQMTKLLAGEVIAGEMRHLTKDGDILWLQYQTRPVMDAAGRVIRLYGAASDITERKKAEAEIISLNRELERRLEEQETLLDLLPVGVCIAQDKELKYLYANRYLSKLTQLKAGNVSAYNPELDATKGWVYYRHGIEITPNELPMLLAVRSEKPVVDYEFDIKLPGTKEALTLVANTAPLFDENGEVRGAIGGFLNITERKHIEEALALTADSLSRERERLNIALRTGGLGVYEWRLGAELIWWSPEIYPLYGVEYDSFVPTIENFLALVHPEDRDELWKKSQECINRAETFAHEYRIVRPDGAVRWIYNRSHVDLDLTGKVERLTGVAVDITERKNAEATLQKSESEFRQLADAVPQFVWVADKNGKVIYVNRRWTEFSGFDLTETAQPELMADLYHPSDRERVLTEWARSVETATTFEVEARLQDRRTGEYKWFLMRSQPARDADGAVIKWFGTSTDITVRKESENRAALLARISDLARSCDDPGTLLYEVACAVGEHLELKRCLFNEIDLDNDLEVVHLDFCNGVPSVAGHHKLSIYSSLTSAEMARGKTIVNRDSKHDPRTAPFYEGTYEPAGERAYIAVPLLRVNRWVASLWVSDDKSRDWRRDEVSLLEFIAEQVWAVVEKLRIDGALRESEARFRNMADHAPVMIWVTDAIGRCNYLSQSWYDFTGMVPNDGLGFGWLDALHPDDHDRVESAFRRANEQKSSFRFEYRLRNFDGEFRWAIDSAQPRFGENGEFLGFIGSVIDISERKAAEQERERLLQREKFLREDAEKANRLKDEFLATVSHELRTPLNAILGWATMAQRSINDPIVLGRALDVIERSARNQNQIISDILDVSRIITGKLQLNWSPVNLSWVFRSAIESLRPSLEAKQIELHTFIENGDGRSFSGDADRLQQIFWNLLSNAVKFTQVEGKIDVALRYHGEFAEIVVQDDGEGIDAAFLPFVFDRFRQADGKKNRKHGGLGLGLAVVRHLTELHGGQVTAESDGLGRGTTFRVSLPMDKGQQVIDGTDTSKRESGIGPDAENEIPGGFAGQLNGVRILVIDDEPDSVELLQFILASTGATVIVNDSAASALEAVGKLEADLIISDIGMPVIDGFEFMSRVRSLESDLVRNPVPALALTAYASDLDRQKALEAGYNGYLPKPVEPAELVQTVVELVSKAEFE